MMKKSLLILTLAMSSEIYAAQICAKSANSFEATECLDKEVKRLRTELNTIYKKVYKQTEAKKELDTAQKSWFNYKDQIIFLNDRVTDNYNLEDSYSDYLAENPNIKKLPFIKRIKYTPNNPLKDYKWENNSTDVWLVKDTLLNEERIHTNQLGNDIKTLGRIKGNMQYLEDFWNIEIRPINFKYAYLNENVLNFTKLNQSKIRDKYLKVKIRYSGEDLTIIQAVKALFTISYA